MTVEVRERGEVEVSESDWIELSRSDEFWRLCEAKVFSVERRRGRSILKAGGYVGRAQCGAVDVVSVEKVPGALAAMLRWAAGRDFRTYLAESPQTELGELMALIVRAFLDEVMRYVSRGRQWEYVFERHRGSMPTGRLRIPETIALRARGMRHLVAFERSVISRSVPVNRIVYAGLRELERLRTMVEIPESLMGKARSLGQIFDDCRDAEIVFSSRARLAMMASKLLSEVAGSDVESLVALAGVILANNSFEADVPLDGTVPLTWFLNLETLFERAVRTCLDSIVAPTLSVRKGSELGRHVFVGGSSLADPDLVVVDPQTADVPLIGDVKYKNWAKGAERSDLYQLHAHAVAFGTNEAFLVYPSDDARFHTEVIGTTVGTGVTIRAFAIDPVHLEGDLSRLAVVTGCIPAAPGAVA